MNRRRVFLLLSVALVLALVAGFLVFGRQIKRLGQPTPADVALPTIINGELVLPKVATTAGNLVSAFNSTNARLGVISANLIGIYDASSQKVAALRIIGETTNVGAKIVTSISPYVRFLDKDDKVVGQKIGKISDNVTFFDLLPGMTSYYDVTVDNPPAAEKLEIVLNVAAASSSAVFEPLKIASKSVEVKTATYQGGASSSGQEKIEYYSMSGRVVNTLSDPVSDISVYGWVKDKDGKVFSFTRQDFKNDLVSPGDKIDFKLTLLPLKDKETYDSYEVAVWGKRYRLNL